jgi:HK97 gp10 family phage protein
VKIYVTGLKETVAKLESLKNTVQKRIMRASLRAALKPVVATARRGVPRGTGNLRKSLGVKQVKRTPRGEFVFLVGARKGFKWGDASTQMEHDPMRYAGPVEMGHVLKVFGRKTGTFIKPAGFLRNAYNQHRVSCVKMFERELKNRVEMFLRTA